MLDRALTVTTRVYFRYVVAVTSVGLFFYGVGRLVEDSDRAAGVTKVGIALAAAGCLFYEQHRAGMRRPISERWKRFVGLTLALAAIVAYFHGFAFKWPRYYHRHDPYHY